MGRRQKLNFKSFQIRIQELCRELLRLCDAPLEANKTAEYFRILSETIARICSLQKNSLSGSVFSGDRETRLNALLNRYKDCLETPISVHNAESAGYGLRTDESFQENTRLLHVPFKYMLCLRNLTTPLPKFIENDPLFSAMDNVALTIATLHELSLGEKSNWKEYISSLPSTYSTVAYLTTDEFAILEGFPAAESALNAYRNICRQYAYFYLLFERMKNEVTLPYFMKSFCFKDYQWAVSTVMSRNNAIPVNENGVGKLLCLIPLWDMINHKQGQITTDYDPVNRSLLFYAMESCQKNEEIFMDYGIRTSTEFLLYSGFVPETNRFHKVPIKLGLSKFDKLLELRNQVLGKLKLTSEISVLISAQEDSFPPANLIAFARVFVMNEDELRTTLRAVSNTDSLLSTTFSDNRIDKEAQKFIEGRLNLLLRGYESRLEKNLKSAQVKNELGEHCVRLCRQDINTLSQCLAAFSAISS
ncbi:hypothetical protein Aperf_G00000035739 [Anoplocephala perfoliata]